MQQNLLQKQEQQVLELILLVLLKRLTATPEQLVKLREIDNLQDFNDSVADLTNAGFPVPSSFVRRGSSTY